MTSRRLDEIASDLDDMSVTLEEIKDQLGDCATPQHAKIDQIRRDMTRAADRIDTIVNRDEAGADEEEEG